MKQPEAGPNLDVVLCDLDGVVWLAHNLIGGSDLAVRLLRGSGARVLFVTNNSHSTATDVAHRLADIGIPAEGDVITSARAAASLLEGGENVLVCGGPGIVEEVSKKGCTAHVAHTIDPRAALGARSFDAVVVGFHREFDFDVLSVASAAIRGGATFIATNEDPTYPTPGGLIPGGGSIVSAVATASGVVPIVAGKPHHPLASVVREEIGDIDNSAIVMVGDRVSTDGNFARTLGCRFALVLSGVGTRDDVASSDIWGDSLLDVTRKLLGHAGGEHDYGSPSA